MPLHVSSKDSWDAALAGMSTLQLLPPTACALLEWCCGHRSGGRSQISASKWTVPTSIHDVGWPSCFACLFLKIYVVCQDVVCQDVRRLRKAGPWYSPKDCTEMGLAAEQAWNSSEQVLFPFSVISVCCCRLHLRRPLLLLATSILEAAAGHLSWNTESWNGLCWKGP